MPTNKDALLRYYLIDELLRRKQKPYVSMEQIQDRCLERLGTRVSVRTLKDDLYRMRYDEQLGYNAPIAYTHIYKGYFYTDETYSIHKLPVTSEELHAARFATALLGGLRHLPMLKAVAGMVEKLEQALRVNQLSNTNQASRILPEPYPSHIGFQYLELCMEMISENKAANLEYQSFGSAKSKRYHVHPYLLKEFRQRWYLLAYDVTAHRLKTFSLDRFIYLEAMDEVFMVDNAFDPALYFQYCYGITYSESVPQTVVLCFTGDSRHYIRTMPLHFSQQILEESETSLTISLLVQPSYELISDILSFGPACKVLAPDSLSTAICTALQETIANY